MSASFTRMGAASLVRGCALEKWNSLDILLFYCLCVKVVNVAIFLTLFHSQSFIIMSPQSCGVFYVA